MRRNPVGTSCVAAPIRWGRLALVSLGLSVLAAGCDKGGAVADQAPAAAVVTADGSRVEVLVQDAGFAPQRVSAPGGKPLTLVFKRVSSSPCGEEVVFPEHDIRKKLPLNEPVEVTVTPEAAQTIQFTCGMNMFKGAIVASR